MSRIPDASAITGDAPRLLILCRRFLGDTVLARPVFTNLRAWRPNAFIAAAAFIEPNALCLYPEVDRTLSVPRNVADFRTRARRWWTLLGQLREERWDFVYDMAQTDRSAAVTLLSCAVLRVGFAQRRFVQRHRAYHHACLWTDDDFSRLHSRDLYLKPLEEVGIPVTHRTVRIDLSPAEIRAARSRIKEVLPFRDRPVLMVHPGAGHPNKCWPPDRFASVCDTVQTASLARVLLLGGPAEASALAEITGAMRTEVTTLRGSLDARQLAALLAQADLFFCNDSGPMHVAAAVGTPVLALYGASSPIQWGPLGSGHTVLRPQMPCDCVASHVCKPPNAYLTNCVRLLSLEEVRDAVLGKLAALSGAAPTDPSPSLAPGHQ